MEISHDGYATEIYSIGFDGAKQELQLTKVSPGLFIVRAKFEFRGQAVESSACSVKL